MTVRYLVQMLTPETEVRIKGSKTCKTLWIGLAGKIIFENVVKDWDFSHGHIIYI